MKCFADVSPHYTPLPSLPDMEGRIEDIGFLELVQLHLGIPHLVLYTLELVVQL